MQCKVAADGHKQLLLSVKKLELIREEQQKASGRGTVRKNTAIVPQIVVDRARCADSMQVQGSKGYPADAARCSRHTVAGDAVRVPCCWRTKEGVKGKQK